jgi:hypothetical protein
MCTHRYEDARRYCMQIGIRLRATNLITAMYRPTMSAEATQKMNSADGDEVQIDKDTYNLAEECAKKLGLAIDEFVSRAIDEKHEKQKRAK